MEFRVLVFRILYCVFLAIRDWGLGFGWWAEGLLVYSSGQPVILGV